jgi:hypothetical protein
MEVPATGSTARAVDDAPRRERSACWTSTGRARSASFLRAGAEEASASPHEQPVGRRVVQDGESGRCEAVAPGGIDGTPEADEVVAFGQPLDVVSRRGRGGSLELAEGDPTGVANGGDSAPKAPGEVFERRDGGEESAGVLLDGPGGVFLERHDRVGDEVESVPGRSLPSRVLGSRGQREEDEREQKTSSGQTSL